MQKGLGRGLEALFGNDTEKIDDITNASSFTSKREADKIVELNISEVEPMLNQPRKIFDKQKLEELAESIKQNGVIQPILVVKDENGYTIIAGERRWRAAKMANLKTIPAIIKDYTDSKKKQVALIENIQREDLNVVEVARAIKELMDIDGYSQSEISKITGKNLSTVSNLMRLLKLQDKILDYLMQGKLVEGQARALLAVEDPKKQLELADKIVEKKMTVRDVEKLIYGSKDYKKGKKKNVAHKNLYYQKVEDNLTEYFGYKAKVDLSKANQKIIIEYGDDEGLSSILSKLNIKM